MRKINSKGFTLIELLAVITILGILMLVAIPAVSRTIENSRRDTFADVCSEYISAVRNAVLSDEIECNSSGSAYTVSSANPQGKYYFPICTNAGDTTCADVALKANGSTLNASTIKTSTTDLLESGGKSSFGSADVRGFVEWEKTETNTSGGEKKTKVVYKIFLQDTGNHGLDTAVESSALKRSNILTKTSTTAANQPSATTSPPSSGSFNLSDYTVCKVS